MRGDGTTVHRVRLVRSKIGICMTQTANTKRRYSQSNMGLRICLKISRKSLRTMFETILAKFNSALTPRTNEGYCEQYNKSAAMTSFLK
jgi:hypothetical protein